MIVFVNGKEEKGDWNTAYEVREQFAKKSDVVIVNGFQINENVELKDQDEIVLIRKGIMPKEEELECMLTARHTPAVHGKLKKGKVAIAGLGGLGSNIAVSLARIGVGMLRLIDFDVVEPSNLNRQNYDIRHLGLLKTVALKQQLQDINPYIQIDTVNKKITEKNAAELLKDCEIVCEAFDNPENKAMLINTVLTHLPGIKIVSASGMAGYKSTNLIRTIHPMKNLYLCGDFETEAMAGCGLMAPRVMVCAGHQANMVLRLLAGEEEV
ncbi:sulfur carrier protein ThiS adenylyltransferase ThiF [Anaeromicropila populeti]|uniref:sulfur carrier protein ThiS adenylyltransferase ThiF n=1 Tax=Anaeromicropila populeti TaxID=37658 RepID=UPI000A88843C|nr:sulfur carrier protein ThiS adenylyltransferase ThiF [Anaeromicropila populeti]